MSVPRSSSGTKSFTVHIPRNSLKIAGIAFGVGIALFIVVWLVSRRDNDFLQADPNAQTPQQVAEVAPLPEPLPAAAGSSDMPDAKPAPPPEETATLVETAPAPPPQPVEAAPAPAPGQQGAPVAADRPMPIPGQSPPPEYPPGALRRGETGSVVLRVDVDAAGQPGGVTLVQRSGSRELDRAAMDAVRQWRFTPAHSNGQAVPGSIEVPFDFKTGQ
ncbi:MAG: hypothetical protein GAK31_01033 [Stenotrophomonas maltophilia]|uniref:TonB C-terminal domain-containing protein n=1 Tax=Stenotrophomonas maltophilia TaxID=40324 RepID=A0A7V8FGQ3_STEMA|nr:MAG: hypothetical protein GAK31_01033 [Stenotrophomonas maltophilia]